MNNKELQVKAQEYIEENNIQRNTYAIEKAFIDGAKMIRDSIKVFPTTEKEVEDFEKNNEMKEVPKHYLSAQELLKEEEKTLNQPCQHPFKYVVSKCNGEINHCLKCGKDI